MGGRYGVVMGTRWIPMGIHGTIASIFTLHENKIKNQPRKCIVGVNGGEDVVFFPPFFTSEHTNHKKHCRKKSGR